MVHRSSLLQRLVGGVEATRQLARARRALHRTTPADITARNAASKSGATLRACGHFAKGQAQLADNISFFIRRMAPLVPWRADCLVQAMACQNWLMARGIPSEIAVGTAKSAEGNFESHAWLVCDGRTILGGDIERYSLLLAPKSQNQSSPDQNGANHTP